MSISTILTIAMFILPVIGALLGLKRGAKRSVARLVTVLLAFVIAIIAAPRIATALLDIQVSTIGNITKNAAMQASTLTIKDYMIEVMQQNEQMKSILEASPSFLDIIVAVPKVLISEILFIVLFFVAKFVLWFVFFIVSLVFLRTPKGKCKFRFLGAVFGFVQGVVCLTVIMVPVIGILNFCEQSTEVLKSDSFSDIEAIQTVTESSDKFIPEVHEATAMKLYEKTKLSNLCLKVFDRLSKVTIGTGDNAKEVYFFNDLRENVLPSLASLMKLSSIDISNIKTTDISDIKQLVSQIGESEIASQVLSEVLSDAATKLKNGEEFMGINLSDALSEDSEVKEVVDNILTTVSNANAESVSNDLETVVDVMDLAAKYKEENPVAEGSEPLTEQEVLTSIVQDEEYNDKLQEIVTGTSFESLKDILESLKGTGVTPPIPEV
ncbi:MAG: CvpA family protein [Eubacteriales bacterium]|nr:CvpA family protein [Eubacteriales bacterium]